MAAFLHDRLAVGDLPLWPWGASAGPPFAADPQSGALYPPALLAYWLLDLGDGLRALALFHYLVAGVGTYALARLLGARRLGALYAGLAFAVSGHLLARAQALGLLSGAAWLPACLGLSQLAVRRRDRAGPAVAGLAAALALLALTGSQQLMV